MNFRSDEFRALCYEFDCLLRIPGVCEGGRGEPCHANWAWAGKGGAMKAADAFVVPGCRACHRELDQGRALTGEVREGYWLRAFGKFLPALFERGLLCVVRNTADGVPRPPLTPQSSDRAGPESGRHFKRRKSSSTASPSKCRIGYRK